MNELASMVLEHKKQLQLLTSRFKNRTLTIDTLLPNIDEFRISPNTLNNLAVKIYNGLDKIKQNKSDARKIFEVAHKRGSSWAKYNLAICLINDEPKDVEEAYRLFSLLLRRLRPQLHEFKGYEHVIYYFSGLHYLNQKDSEKAYHCLNLVADNSPHYKQARVKLMSLPIPNLVQGNFWAKEKVSVDSPVVLIRHPFNFK